MTNDEIRPLLNRRVRVVNRPNLGSYLGKLVGFRPGRFALGELVILNPDGSTKVASKTARVRWFATANCTVEAVPLDPEKQRLAEVTGKLVQGLIETHHPQVQDEDELQFLAAFYTPEAARDARATLSAVDEYLCG